MFRGILRHCLVDNGMDREGGEGLRKLFGIPDLGLEEISRDFLRARKFNFKIKRTNSKYSLNV